MIVPKLSQRMPVSIFSLLTTSSEPMKPIITRIILKGRWIFFASGSTSAATINKAIKNRAVWDVNTQVLPNKKMTGHISEGAWNMERSFELSWVFFYVLLTGTTSKFLCQPIQKLWITFETFPTSVADTFATTCAIIPFQGTFSLKNSPHDQI